MAVVTICSDFGAQENKVSRCFHCFPIYFPWSDGPDAMILVFWMLSFKLTGFPDSSVGTKSTCNTGDPSSIPGLRRSAGEVKKLPSPVIWPWELVHGVSSQKVRQNWATFTFIEASLIAQLVKNEWVMLSKCRDSFICLLLSHFSRVRLCVTP